MDIKKELELVLQRYIEDIERNDDLREHDKRFGGHIRHVESKCRKLKPPLNVISKRLYTMAKDTFYLIELFNYKIYLLAKGIQHSIDTENPLTLANNTRAMIEQVAVYHNCISAIWTMSDNLKDQGSCDKVSTIIEKCENTLKRTYSGQGKVYAGDGEKAVHINEAIKSLSSEISDAKKVYDYLCEFVHPNFGGNLLVSSGKLGKGNIGSKALEDANIEKMLGIILSAIEHLNYKELINPAVTWQLEHYVELCMMPKATLGGVFADKKAVPIGDGQSIKTAFFFKNARTSQEGMKLMYQYFSDIGYDVNPKHRTQVTDLESIKAGYHLDLWQTPLGKMYFKTKSYVGL